MTATRKPTKPQRSFLELLRNPPAERTIYFPNASQRDMHDRCVRRGWAVKEGNRYGITDAGIAVLDGAK